MSHDNCDNLDAFLADDLSSGTASDFTAHLDECESGHEAIDQQRWIDGLLRSPLGAELEALPFAFTERIRQLMLQRRRKLRFIACGLAMAAALLVAIGWTALVNRQPRSPVAVDTNDVVAASAPEPLPSAQPRATFVGGPDVLVVPVESQQSNVTIVRVYPVYQPDYSAQASADSPPALDEFTWPLNLNGG